jgi:hypothetical protein
VCKNLHFIAVIILTVFLLFATVIALMIVTTSEMLVDFYHATLHSIPENSSYYHCENLKSHTTLIVCSCNCGTLQAKNGLENPWFSIITEMLMLLL